MLLSSCAFFQSLSSIFFLQCLNVYFVENFKRDIKDYSGKMSKILESATEQIYLSNLANRTSQLSNTLSVLAAINSRSRIVARIVSSSARLSYIIRSRICYMRTFKYRRPSTFAVIDDDNNRVRYLRHEEHGPRGRMKQFLLIALHLMNDNAVYAA
jgi:hypothetical protein